MSNVYKNILLFKCNMVKIIHVSINDNESISEIINSFSPEENLKMLEIGSNAIFHGRNFVANMSKDEISKNIRNETNNIIQNYEIDKLVQKELLIKTENNISKMYENQMDYLKTKMSKIEGINNSLLDQIRIYEKENNEKIKEEVKVFKNKFDLLLQEKDKKNQLNRESFDLLLQEKDKQNNLNREAFDKLSSLTNMTNTGKGKSGEKKFVMLAETFKDFNNFNIVDKHMQGGEGDFHLSFEDFNVLVDAKNYKGSVPVNQRDKIKKDLIKNDHINFAWMVSLNTSIDKFDKSPIMYEWISTSKCICYINNLLQYDEPEKILRVVFFTCKELFRLIKDENMDVSELSSLREEKFKQNDKIKLLRKSVRELNTNCNTFKKMIEGIDDQLKYMLELETNNIIDSNLSIIDDWWNNNIEVTDNSVTINSTDIWFKFRQENKDCIKTFDITIDSFKKFIKTKIPMNSLTERTKNGAFDIKGIIWKEKLVTSKQEKVNKVNNKKNNDNIIIKTELPMHYTD